MSESNCCCHKTKERSEKEQRDLTGSDTAADSFLFGHYSCTSLLRSMVDWKPPITRMMMNRITAMAVP